MMYVAQKKVDGIIMMAITSKVFEGHKKGGLVRKEARIATPNTIKASCN